MSELKFLGYNFSPEGMQPVRQKTEAIKVFPAPTSAKALLGFLGALNNYYRRCLPPINGKTVSEILQPLYEAAMAERVGEHMASTMGWWSVKMMKSCLPAMLSQK